MVLLTVTPPILDALEKCKATGVTRSWMSQVDKLALGDAIPHDRLIDLSRATCQGHRRGSRQGLGLDHLLQGTRVYRAPAKPRTAPTPEYEALMTRLHAEEEQRLYERMTYAPAQKDTFSQMFPSASKTFAPLSHDKADDAAVTSKDIDRQLTLIINILVSIIASGVAIFIIARHWPAPQRLALSLAGSLIIAIAEVVIYDSFTRRARNAIADGAKIVEVKDVLDSWVVQGSSKDSNTIRTGGNSLRNRKGRYR